MKKATLYFSVLAFILSISLTSCLKPDLEGINDVSEGELILRGIFENGQHPTSGIVSVYRKDDKDYLVFEAFKTDSGPDLRVYMSKDQTDTDFIDLKRLIATQGTFFYEIPEKTIIEEYNNVLIWCRAFSVLFGSAEMI
jgi:hypothetical protein